MAETGTAREILVRASRRSSDILFSKAEYGMRLKNIRSEMARCGIDMLFLSSPESMFYVCGYRAEWYQAQSPKSWPPASGIAVRADENDLILFDYDDEELMDKCETVCPDIRIYPESGGRSFIEWMLSELRKGSWLPCTVGLEKWSYRPNRATSEMFQTSLEKEGCRVVDGSDIVRKLRLVKSPNEMSCIRKASKIADIGMKAAIETIRPGMSELQVYGEIVGAMATAGGENPGITIPVISGRRCAMSHALASRKKIVRRDIINIDICGVYNRYHSNMARTFSMGRPAPEVEKVVNLSAGSFDVVSKLIRPNLGIADFLGTMRSYYEQVGILRDKMWSGGYELGIAFPPDWVGAFNYDETLDCSGKVFLPMTVVNYESNFFLPKKAGASLLINTLEFGRTKANILSRVPNELIVLGT